MNILNGDEAAPLVPKHGIPASPRDDRSPFQKQLALYTILVSILFERMAFYTLAANLAIALESKTAGTRSVSPFLFYGTSYLSSIIFAVISDWKFGRAKTIIVGFILYLLGYASVISITTVPIHGNSYNCNLYLSNMSCTTPASQDCSTCINWIIATLIIIAIGAGAVESNMAVLGAEQIQDSKITSRYFDKYMLAVNIGGTIATGVTLVIPNNSDGQGPYYLYSAVAAGSALVIATLLTIVGYRYYINATTHETIVTNCIPVIINAFQSRHTYNKQKKSSRDNDDANVNVSNTLQDSNGTAEENRLTRTGPRPATFLDYAKLPRGRFHDRIVDEVKSLRGFIVVFTLLIPYWLIYNQLSSTFRLQAKNMDRMNDNTLTYVWLGDPVTVIVGISILILFVYKFLNVHHQSSTITIKFVIGMCLACLTMCIAGSIELIRQKKCQNKSNLSILYQLPQNIFMGLSEIFATLASFEYAYFAAPRSAQTLFMSLRFCSLGISSYLANGYFAIFKNTPSRLDFSCQHRDQTWPFYTYFFVLAGIQFVFILIFIVCQKKFEIIKLNPQQTETNVFRQQSSTSGR